MTVEYLSTARVLVIDDHPKEAIPILTALGTIGVGCIYIKGDKVEDLPKEPAEGIRLVFLDMRLAEGGNQKAVLSKTLSVLKKCVSTKTIPLIVVCWTKHPDDVEVFKQMAIQNNDFPALQPNLILRMPKPANPDPEKWNGILKKISTTLKSHKGIALVWKWENVLHGAVTDTSQTLADVSAHFAKEKAPNSPDWEDGLFSVCQELVRAEVGLVCNKKNTSNALLRTMNELAIDRVHHLVMSKPFPMANKLIPPQESSLKLEHVSRLHEMILIEEVANDEKDIKPGSIFIFQPRKKKCLFKKLGVDIEELKKHIDNKGNLGNNATPILIEMSPACDYAQNKRPVCTFIAGFTVPIDSGYKIDRQDHLIFLGPTYFPKQKEETKRIVVTKRFVYSCPLLPNDITNHPIGRLRTNVLIDMQVQMAMYKARPGFLFLTYNHKKQKNF